MEKYDDILVQRPVRTKGKIDSDSHYNDKDLKYGRSRDAGDASPEVQRWVVHSGSGTNRATWPGLSCWAKRTLLIGLLSLFAVPLLVSTTFAGDLSTMEDRLSCGTMEVRAFTTCRVTPTSVLDSECTEQYFLFADSKTGTSVKVVASGQLKKMRGAHGKIMGTGLDALACECACVKGGANTTFVLIHYWNGGICDECAWDEIFDVEGHRLATSKVPFRIKEKEAGRIRSAFDKKYRELGLPMPWPESSFRQFKVFERPRLSE